MHWGRRGESPYQKHVEEQARWWRARGIQLAEDLLECPEDWLGGGRWRDQLADPGRLLRKSMLMDQTTPVYGTGVDEGSSPHYNALHEPSAERPAK